MEPPIDLKEFWAGTLQQLAEVPIDAEVEEHDTKDFLQEYVKTFQNYSVRMSSFGRTKIRAWLTLPIGSPPAEGWPAILTFPGYRGVQPLPVHYTRYGYATLCLYPRGQGESLKDEAIDIGATKFLGREDNWYRGAYADCIRGVDFLSSRPEIDASRIGCWGMSQGGGLALSLGALDQRIKLAAAELPSCCDIARTSKPTAPGGQRDRRAYFMEHPEKEALVMGAMEYFDNINLAPMIQCPVLMNAAHVDEVHPYDGIVAVFNKIRTKKSLCVYPHLELGARADFCRHTLEWFDRFMR